ncbi:MAG: hypothetical protein AAB706_02395 [Patescibacteria group bacterium]
MENRIHSWDFVSLRRPLETSEGLVPEKTSGRVLEFQTYDGNKQCRVLLSEPRCHVAIVSPEDLEFKSSHVKYTRAVLSLEKPAAPMFHNIPSVMYANA